MKIIAIAAVTAGGKTAVVNELVMRLSNAQALHFDDYTFEGEVDDFHQWAVDGADYHVWDLSPLKEDILRIQSKCDCEWLVRLRIATTRSARLLTPRSLSTPRLILL